MLASPTNSGMRQLNHTERADARRADQDWTGKQTVINDGWATFRVLLPVDGGHLLIDRLLAHPTSCSVAPFAGVEHVHDDTDCLRPFHVVTCTTHTHTHTHNLTYYSLRPYHRG
jgi:hypothetical protein